jgi:hypothetical protein
MNPYDRNSKYHLDVDDFGYLNILPQNIKDFLKAFYTGVSIAQGSTDCLNQYGHATSTAVIVTMYSECCDRCGWHSLFRPVEPLNEHGYQYCKRHLIRRQYDTVFTWRPNNKISLEDAFNNFLNMNPRLMNKKGFDLEPVKTLHISVD